MQALYKLKNYSRGGTKPKISRMEEPSDISLTLGNNTVQLFGSSKGLYYFLTSPEEFLQVLSMYHFGGKNYGTFKAGMSRENKLESQSSSVNCEKFPKMGFSPCHVGRIYLVGNTSKMM